MNIRQEYRPLDSLKNWEKNPRGITDRDFKRLVRQILRLGIYKAQLINEEGITLGGNMRLRGYRAIVEEYKLYGAEKLAKKYSTETLRISSNQVEAVVSELTKKGVLCSVVDAKTEQQITEYALSDNDSAGFYDDEALGELILSLPEIDLRTFKVNMGKAVSLESIVKSFGPDDSQPAPKNYEEDFQVIIKCKDEKEQKAVYEKLSEEGYEVSILTI